MRSVDVLIPTCGRPAALAVTLAALALQTFSRFRVFVADQTKSGAAAAESGEVQAVVRLLEERGHPVQLLRNVPQRGMAQQRQFLLDQAHAEYVLYLDDEVDPDLFGRHCGDVLARWRVMAKHGGCGVLPSGRTTWSCRRKCPTPGQRPGSAADRR